MIYHIEPSISEKILGITRTSLMTFQENHLIWYHADDRYRADPYIPLAVLDGRLSVEECDKLRQEGECKGEFWTVFADYWNVNSDFGVATLERLDLNTESENYGQTIADPELKELFPGKKTINWGKLNFPFARGKPRVWICG